MDFLDKNIITITNSKGEVKQWEVVESDYGIACIVKGIEEVLESPYGAYSWLSAVNNEEIDYLEVKVEVLKTIIAKRK